MDDTTSPPPVHDAAALSRALFAELEQVQQEQVMLRHERAQIDERLETLRDRIIGVRAQLDLLHRLSQHQPKADTSSEA